MDKKESGNKVITYCIGVDVLGMNVYVSHYLSETMSIKDGYRKFHIKNRFNTVRCNKSYNRGNK